MIIKRHILIRQLLNIENRYQIINFAVRIVTETHNKLYMKVKSSTMTTVYNIVENILIDLIQARESGTQIDCTNFLNIYNQYMERYIDTHFKIEVDNSVPSIIEDEAESIEGNESS